MKLFLILSAIYVTTFAAPQGYTYKEPAAVVEHGNLNGFLPTTQNGLPCAHAAHYNVDSVGAAAGLIQSQSTGRIVNHHHHNHDHSLETAASGISSQTQAVTVNSHIVVGDSGSEASSLSGASQGYRAGEGYVQGGAAQSSGHFNQIAQAPPQIPSQPFNPGHLSPGNVVPSQLVSSQNQGYSYNQGSASHANHHVHHHYESSLSGSGGISQAASRVPLTTHLQPVPSYSGSNYPGPQSAAVNSIPIRIPAPYRPVGSIGGPRPINHYANAGNQFSSNRYQQGSFGQNIHGAQAASNTHSQFGAAGAYDGSFGHSAHATQVGANSHSQFGNSHFGSAAAAHSGGQSSGIFGTTSSGTPDALKGQLGHVIRETFANAPLDPTVEKHIYVHVPPEDLEDGRNQLAVAQRLTQASPKKHYKIIFIKAPTQATPNYAQLAAAAAPQSEEKTLVYVLVKKPDEPSFEEIQQIQNAAIKSNKPEVYFIKYKTRKEGETQEPSFADASTQYNSESQFSSFGGASASPLEGNGAGIDIRLGGGESNSISSSYTTSSSSSTSATNGVKHALYGVPLE